MIKSEFKVGLPVIINTTDRPFVGLIAVCKSLKDGVLTCKYLTKYPSLKECFASENRILHVTKVSDFGVELSINFDNTIITAKQISESAAKYEDGKKRSWQPEGSDSKLLTNAAYKLYEKYLYSLNQSN